MFTKYVIYTILYFIIGGVFVYFLKNKNNSKNFSPAYKGFIFGMILYYIIIPILILTNVSKFNEYELSMGKYGANSIQQFIISGSNNNFLLAMGMVVLTFICFNFAYSYVKKHNKKVYNADKTYKIVKTFTYITFIIGIISLIIVFLSFGGIKQALSHAEYLRSFSNNASDIINNSSFLILTSRLITVSPFLLIYLLDNTTNNKKYKIMLIISFIMSILFYMFNAGRMPLLAFLICFAYMILKKKVKKTWTLIIVVSIISLPLLDILDTLFYYFNNGLFTFKNINYIRYIFQFIFPYRNILIMNNIVSEFGLRYGKDFITSFIDMLPGISFDASYVNTSIYIRGSSWKQLGGIPNDFITFGYLQFSFVGVIIHSLFMGGICKVIDSRLGKFKDGISKDLLSAAITIYILFLIPYADFVSILKSNFILTILIFIILCSTSKRKE